VDSFGQATKFGYDLNGMRASLTDAENKATRTCRMI
jgi:YD repeat-containing protein